jgi:hypothetical protein
MSILQHPVQPWYREPWPWLVMSGPAIVVVAGIATAVIAFRTSDGLVADDYYKQGLVINQTLKRDEKALAMGLGAELLFSPGREHIRLTLSGQGPGQGVQALHLSLLHPTQAGRDQEIALRQIAPGLYEAAMLSPGSGTWRLQVEDRVAGWRLVGAWRSNQDHITLGHAPSNGGAK